MIEINIIHKVEIKNGKIYLDGMRVRGIRAFEMKAKENDNLVELSLRMDVRIAGDNGVPELGGLLDEHG